MGVKGHSEGWASVSDSAPGSDMLPSNLLRGHVEPPKPMAGSSPLTPGDYKWPLSAGAASEAVSRLRRYTCHEHVVATCMALETPFTPRT